MGVEGEQKEKRKKERETETETVTEPRYITSHTTQYSHITELDVFKSNFAVTLHNSPF